MPAPTVADDQWSPLRCAVVNLLGNKYSFRHARRATSLEREAKTDSRGRLSLHCRNCTIGFTGERSCAPTEDRVGALLR